MKLPKMKRKKIVAINLWQWNCRNGRKKNSSSWFVAMLLLEWKGEKKLWQWSYRKLGRERIVWIKNIILDSYSKKYTYSYSFRVSIVFLTKTVWFVRIWCSYNTKWKKKMIEVHTINKKNKETKIFAEILCSEYMFIVK